MAWLFTEYDEARYFQVLHWNFSIPRATLYSVNSETIVHLFVSFVSQTAELNTQLEIDKSASKMLTRRMQALSI